MLITKFRIKDYLHLFEFISFFSIIIFIIYLHVNIITVGSFGKALPILGFYFLSALSIFIFLIFNLNLTYKNFEMLNLSILILFWGWIVFRSLWDLNDLYQLKQITIATTGGIILFYMTGFFFQICHELVQRSENKNSYIVGILSIFFVLLILLALDWSGRLVPNEFKLGGVGGKYQRPGNFISISQIIISVLILNFSNIKYNKILIIIYSIISAFLLICSQLIWSNSSTGIVLGVFLITIFLNSFKFRNEINKFKINEIISDKKNLYYIVNSIGLVLLLITILIISVYLFGGRFNNLRVFGFGTGLMDSLLIRYDQIYNYGISQITYSPIFGNMNVAYIVTGNKGITLHSLFLNVIASLGIVGLMLIITLIWLILKKIIQDIKIKSSNEEDIQRISKIQILVLFLFIILFANISTGFTWAVLWFTIGFSNKIIILEKK